MFPSLSPAPIILYGEWLRRENRRTHARRELRLAHDMFGRIGTDAFAQRACRELTATVDTVCELTAQEVEIARMARDGHTNPEIGARLFISSRTVEWHLHKVFAKLEVTSRRGSARHSLPDSSRATARACDSMVAGGGGTGSCGGVVGSARGGWVTQC